MEEGIEKQWSDEIFSDRQKYDVWGNVSQQQREQK